MDEEYESILIKFNYIFVAIFTVEAILKITGLGPVVFWLDKWNKFDSVIVVFSLLALDTGRFNFNASLLRVFRIARLFRMIKVSKGLS